MPAKRKKRQNGKKDPCRDLKMGIEPFGESPLSGNDPETAKKKKKRLFEPKLVAIYDRPQKNA